MTALQKFLRKVFQPEPMARGRKRHQIQYIERIGQSEKL